MSSAFTSPFNATCVQMCLLNLLLKGKRSCLADTGVLRLSQCLQKWKDDVLQVVWSTLLYAGSCREWFSVEEAKVCLAVCTLLKNKRVFNALYGKYGMSRKIIRKFCNFFADRMKCVLPLQTAHMLYFSIQGPCSRSNTFGDVWNNSYF